MPTWWPIDTHEHRGQRCFVAGCTETIGYSRDDQGRVFCHVHRERHNDEMAGLLRQAENTLSEVRAQVDWLSQDTTSPHLEHARALLNLALLRLADAIGQSS